MKDHFVYILQANNRNLYVGYTTDLQRRMQAHASGKGAKFTRAFGFGKLLYHETHPTKSSALRREAEIKKWSRLQKIIFLKEKNIPITLKK